jgi:hypothetical protein
MKVVVNRGPGLFRLSHRAYSRLIALGCPVKPAVDDWKDVEPGVVSVFDNYQPGVIVSDNPDDAEGDHGWLHTDARYYDTVFADELWSRAMSDLIRVVEELGEHAGQMGCIPDVVDIGDQFDSWSIINDGGKEAVRVTKKGKREIVWRA